MDHPATKRIPGSHLRCEQRGSGRRWGLVGAVKLPRIGASPHPWRLWKSAGLGMDGVGGLTLRCACTCRRRGPPPADGGTLPLLPGCAFPSRATTYDGRLERWMRRRYRARLRTCGRRGDRDAVGRQLREQPRERVDARRIAIAALAPRRDPWRNRRASPLGWSDFVPRQESRIAQSGDSPCRCDPLGFAHPLRRAGRNAAGVPLPHGSTVWFGMGRSRVRVEAGVRW